MSGRRYLTSRVDDAAEELLSILYSIAGAVVIGEPVAMSPDTYDELRSIADSLNGVRA